MIRKLAFTFGLVITAVVAFSQGRISGTVIDKDANEPIPFANVVVYSGGVQRGITQTDFDGKYAISPLNAGSYTIICSYAGEKKEIAGVTVESNKTRRLDIEFSTAVEITGVDVYVNKIIDVDETSITTEYKPEDIKDAPTRSVATLAAQSGSVTSSDDGGALNIGGNRSENNLVMVNGVKMNTTSIPNLPMAAINSLQIITGGVPAQYGDVTGGVINITTKVGAEKYSGGIELETGAPFNAWNQSLVSMNLSGPIKTRDRIDEFDDGNGNIISDTVKETVLGFFMSGQYQYQKDPRPTVIKDRDGKFRNGIYTVKEDTLNYINDNPLVANGDGYLYSAEQIDFDDLEITKARNNVSRNSVQLNTTFEYYANQNTTISFGANLDYRKYHDYIVGYGLMNYGNNPLVTTYDYNVWGRFRQSFGSSSADDSSSSLIKNAYYQVQFDYTVNKTKTEDDTHKKNFFRYGHVGTFATPDDYMVAGEDFNLGQSSYIKLDNGQNTVVYDIISGDSLAAVSPGIENVYVTSTTGGFIDPYEFTESEYNPIAAGYITHYQELSGSENVNFLDLLQAGLFFNGARARVVHDLWYGPGREYGGYSEALEEQYRLSGMAAADVGNHNLTFGFEYEQRVRSTYAVNDAVGLWFMAFGNVNTHIDTDTKTTTITEDVNASEAYVDVTYAFDETKQTKFDAELRDELGITDKGKVINIWEVNPDQINLSMFDANDLITFQNADWIGYDHTGKRVRGGNTTFQDFFYDTINRPQSSFKPIYAAFYMQDKFEINDLILRLGVRVDRYDANQVILKDKYSTVYLDKVSETDLALFKNGDDYITRPELIEDDWTIYVDQASSDLNGNQGSYSIVGFRDGDNWYDAQGNRVRGYSYISATNDLAPGNAEPWFTYAEGVTGVDKNIFDQRQLDVNGAFEDFKAKINVMPRISFSFPVNDMATFFANYDVLTKRPDPNRTRVRPSDFYFLSQDLFVNNPNLKPQQQINYQLGFKQALDKKQTVAMTLSAAYQERKNEVQFTQVQNAFPGAYTTFDNIDFSTVKRGEVAFDTRRINNVKVNANYTISFAEGTGSSTTTALTLVRQGLGNIRVPTALSFDQRHAIKVNLDYRLDSGKGPTIAGRKILGGAGASMQIYAGSGNPYTKFANSNTSEIFITAVGRNQLDGGINTSRLPWNNRVSLRIYKNFDVRGKSNALNVYLRVQNLLNARNIVGVYNNTGSPDDDGYMSVRNDANTISQAETDMYFARLTAPSSNNYSMPRRIRIGMSYFF